MDAELLPAITLDEESTQELLSLTQLNTAFSNPYITLATSHNTRRAYQSDIRHYENWGGQLPATPDTIANYLHYFADKLNPRTLARRLIAIKHWHRYQQFTDPTDHPGIQKTMTGILRTHGKPKNKAKAITPEELKQIHDHLVKENTISAARDDALLQIGFFAALRRSELVAIKVEHISWDKVGIEILLPTSKTDQTHEGQYCAIPYGNNSLCPITALKTWLETSGIKEGPIFRRITANDFIGHTALSPSTVNQILKKRCEEVDIHQAKLFSAHSLRRGLATSAVKSGAPIHAIMRAGRWKQFNTVMEYIEANARFTENVVINVLNNLEQNE